MKTSQAKRLKELEKENQSTGAGGGRSDGGQHDPEGSVKGKFLSPERRRRCVVRPRPAAARGEPMRGERARCWPPGSIDTTEESEERG